jgi:uncharacterized small protein (TIGR04563 family)
MSPPDKRKQSVYFSVEILKEIADAANRLDRSMSWIVQKAWKLARAEMTRVPAARLAADAGLAAGRPEGATPTPEAALLGEREK